jgi:hypothetical protein
LTIRALALCRVINAGMTTSQATAMLERFERGKGKDIDWLGIAPRLSKDQAERVDDAGTAWMLNPANAARPEPVMVRQFRDGKKLAAGDEDEPWPPEAA